MEKKTLGQIAYEAYCEETGWKSLISGAAILQWVDLKNEIKNAWERSGQAIKLHLELVIGED